MNRVDAVPARDRIHETGLLVFLATATMLFTAFAAAYLVRRASADWNPVPLPKILWPGTAALLAAGFAIEWARRRLSRKALLVAGGLGVLFAGLQLLAWEEMASQGAFASAGAHSSFFYAITAVHGVHLLGGLAFLPWVFARPTERSTRLTAIYWHFLGAVWLAMFALLSLL